MKNLVNVVGSLAGSVGIVNDEGGNNVVLKWEDECHSVKGQMIAHYGFFEDVSAVIDICHLCNVSHAVCFSL